MKIFLGDKEIKLGENFKINTIPWYKRWFFRRKIKKMYREYYKKQKGGF